MFKWFWAIFSLGAPAESTHVNENEVKDSDAASDSNEEDWFLYHLIIFNSFYTCLQGARNTLDSK